MNGLSLTCWGKTLSVLVEDLEIADFILSLTHISGIPAKAQIQTPSSHVITNKRNPTLYIQDRSTVELEFTPETQTLTLYIRWSAIKHKPSTITNILGQLLSLACVDNGEFPLHSAVVSRDGKAYLIIGDSGAGKTNLSVVLCKKGNFQWLANDWSAIGIDNNEAMIVRGYDLINFRKLGFQLVDLVPEAIAHQIEAEFQLNSDSTTKSSFFTSEELGLSRGAFPTPVAGIFFVQIAPITDNHFTSIESSQATERLLRELFWPLRGLGSFVIDNEGKVISSSAVLTPLHGWGKMSNTVNLLTNRYPCYNLNSSLEAAYEFVSHSTVK